MVTGLYVPKYPPVSVDGLADHVPADAGVPPKLEYKFADEPLEQKDIDPLLPALGAAVIVIVATLTSLEQGAVPVTVY